MSSFALIPPIAASVAAAAAHLRSRQAVNGCGCPAWEPSLDPDAAPVAHDATCPMAAVDRVFASQEVVGPALQHAIDAGGPPQQAWARAERAVGGLDDNQQAAACVVYGLALLGVVRTAVNAEAVAGRRTHDLTDRAAETFAVLDRITSSPRIPLGPETVARLLASSRPDLEVERLQSLLAGDTPPQLTELPLTSVVTALVAGVNAEVVALTAAGSNPERQEMNQLACEGFNLLAGIPSLVVSAHVVDDRA